MNQYLNFLPSQLLTISCYLPISVSPIHPFSIQKAKFKNVLLCLNISSSQFKMKNSKLKNVLAHLNLNYLTN